MVDKIRILYVIDALEFGGGERGFSQLSTGIDKKRFKTYLAAHPESKLEEMARLDNISFIPIDMDRKVSFKKPILHKKEISFDCDHSLTYALMQIKTKNQKGLMAMVIEIFDQFKIDIATAKINTVKNTARDTFLIEKSEPFCDNREKIVDLLVKHD